MKQLAAIMLTAVAMCGCSMTTGHPVTSSEPAPTENPSPRASPVAATPSAIATQRATPQPSLAMPTGSLGALPVDPSIDPVSLSNPSAGAAEALKICQVLDLHGPQKVTGMGEIPHARNAVQYAALTGREPEIQTDAPAWVITFGGELPMPKAQEVWIDPTCVVVDRDGGIYATGPVRMQATGETVAPPADASVPDKALPPLIP